MGDVVIKPDNSLLRQARDAIYHPGVIDNENQRNIIVNGDGFGLGWYGASAKKGACCCKFITPAWSNANLRNLGEYIVSPLFLVHVRAATNGFNQEEEAIISNENCHPFKYGRWTFCHNGGIPHFKKMKRSIILHIKEAYFQDISGNTDSEYIFALFLSLLPNNRDEEATMSQLIHTINTLISTILELCVATGIKEPPSLNICVTDGTNIVATRYRNGECPPSLYYKLGCNFRCENGRLVADESTQCPENQCMVISSAPLSRFCSSGSCPDDPYAFDSSLGTGWVLVPEDHMLICEGNPTDISRIQQVYTKPITARIGRGLLVRAHIDKVKTMPSIPAVIPMPAVQIPEHLKRRKLDPSPEPGLELLTDIEASSSVDDQNALDRSRSNSSQGCDLSDQGGSVVRLSPPIPTSTESSTMISQPPLSCFHWMNTTATDCVGNIDLVASAVTQ